MVQTAEDFVILAGECICTSNSDESCEILDRAVTACHGLPFTSLYKQDQLPREVLEKSRVILSVYHYPDDNQYNILEGLFQDFKGKFFIVLIDPAKEVNSKMDYNFMACVVSVTEASALEG